MESWFVAGTPKWDELHQSPALTEALSGLVHLGYREDEAREWLSQAKARVGDKAASSQLLQEALRLVGGRIS
ncbi:Holliday junction ATP-dependent DNA helicase RuvA [compost metagenome]